MSTTDTFYEERRRDKAAEAEERRKDRAAEAEQRRQNEAARVERERRDRQDGERETKKRRDGRRATRAALYGKVRNELDTALALAAITISVVPALYFQLRALNGEDLPGAISLCLAMLLEIGTWVATVTGERAKREGRPTARFRASMWGCAAFAAAINYSHAPGADWLAWVLAASSLGGVFFWEMRGWGRHKTRSARTRAQRREERRRRRHDRKRRRRFRAVHARYVDILTAHPYGTVAPETAWEQAWRDTHGAELAVTAGVVAHRGRADRALAAAHGVGVETLAVEELLGELFPGDGGDDGPATRRSSGGPNGGPGKGGRGLKSLGRKGKRAVARASGRTAPKTPKRPLEEAHLDKVRALADMLGGTAKLSVSTVRHAVGGGSNEYMVRLRNAVCDERKGGRR
ncbi:DUF2637 domain-containing protein [Streptomyces violascens]|uniref:DUF2637 domain-containing protein n=1 Tax=Streptomyces violascens TaxID=67381 RepID=UPI0036AC9AA7